ncbi:MAG: sodium:proton antiporter [Lawsonibacter sp.]|nr:sodium:proton antiporter [Lawsonibacter sp.]
MDLLAAFGIFLLCVAGCMVRGLPLYWALLAGFFCFFAVGVRRGTPVPALLNMAAGGMRTSFKVLRILLLLGLLTALWRAGGTVAFFVCTGVRLITPGTFVLAAFLLSAVFSLAFGSCFGVVGTAGVILMTIARGSGASLPVTAGAIMSGIYFGERLSPASSSSALTAAVAHVSQREFQLRMWRDTAVPLLASLALYGGLSVLYPIRGVDPQILSALEEGFVLTWPAALPAAALLLLPWLKVSTVVSISVSCVLAAGCAIFLQGLPAEELLRACVLGYRPALETLSELMSGGGLISMVSVVLIVILSCAYSGMFNGTGLLAPVTGRVGALVERFGLFTAHIAVSLGCCALFCNQTVGIVMSAQLMGEEYRDRPPLELAANIGNSVINLAGLVPWAIAASVPLTTMEVSAAALPLSFYLYLVPLWCWFVSRRAERRRPETRTKG